MHKTFKIRRLKKGEEHQMQELINPVFRQFVAPAFPAEGIKEFLKVLHPEAVKTRIKKGNRVILVAETLKKAQIIGLIEFKNYNHISLFFVKSKLHGQGIGRSLLKKCVSLCKRTNRSLKRITVHSSPNAVGIYKKLGFVKVGKGRMRQKNGIRFVNMKLEDI